MVDALRAFGALVLVLGGCSSQAVTEPLAGAGGAAGGGANGTGGAQLSDALFPPDARIGDRDFSDWIVTWVRWMAGIPADVHPVFGEDCAQQQPSELFFLFDANVNQILDARCTVPADRPLFVPVVVFFCAPNPEEQGCTTPRTEAELVFCAEGAVATLTDAWVILDDEPLAPLERFHFMTGMFSWKSGDPPPFSWTPAIAPNDCGIPEGDRYGVFGGIWVMLRPLSPGAHTLEVGGTRNTPASSAWTGVRFALTVSP